MTGTRSIASLTVAVCALAIGASAQASEAPDSWPDYRGPSWNGHAPDAKLPLDWSEKRNVRWKTKISGKGWSSPVIQDGRVWLTSATRNGREMFVIAIDVKTGKKVVERTVFKNKSPDSINGLNSYASPSPTSESGRIYVHFGTYGTACLDTSSGRTIWQRRNINCDHLEGPGSSPVLVDDLLIFNADGGDVQFVIALDKKTGMTRWKRPRSTDFSRMAPDLRKAFGTPILIDVDGEQQLVSSGAHATMGYDPNTGKELWRIRYRGFSMSSRPLFANGMVFMSTGFMRPQLYAFRPGKTRELSSDSVAWVCRRSVPTMSSPLIIDGLIYMVSDRGIATCLDAKTGESQWRKRLGGSHCASPIYAGGRIYFFDRDGRTVVIAPGKKFKKLGENRLADGFMASPAVIGNALILRTETHLYRIEEE